MLTFCTVDAETAAAEPAAAPAPAVEVPAVPLTRKVIKKRQRKTECKVTEIVDGTIVDAVMVEFRQQEASMGAQVNMKPCLRAAAIIIFTDIWFQDRLIKETADRKNELESYVCVLRTLPLAPLPLFLMRVGSYAMRDKIGEGAELGPYISSEDRATFGKMLEEVEEWLYSEEADEGTKVIVRVDFWRRYEMFTRVFAGYFLQQTRPAEDTWQPARSARP